MIFFKRKENPVKKAAKEAEKKYYRITGLIDKGMLEEAYSESIETYRNLRSFPQEEIDNCSETINCIVAYLCRLCVLARLLKKFDECISWGNEYFNEIRRIYSKRGLNESEILRILRGNDVAWTVWFNMALANFMKGDYVEALNLISEYLGKSGKINVPDSVIERFRGKISLVTKFIAEQQLTRFLVAAFMANLVPEDYKELVLTIDKDLAEHLLRKVEEIISDEKKLEKVFEKYVEANISREVAEADVSTVKMLVKSISKSS